MFGGEVEVTGADPGDPIGEGTGGPITHADGMALMLRIPDAGGTAGAGYVPRGESSFTDNSCPVVEEGPRVSLRRSPLMHQGGNELDALQRRADDNRTEQAAKSKLRLRLINSERFSRKGKEKKKVRQEIRDTTCVCSLF